MYWAGQLPSHYSIFQIKHATKNTRYLFYILHSVEDCLQTQRDPVKSQPGEKATQIINMLTRSSQFATVLCLIPLGAESDKWYRVCCGCKASYLITDQATYDTGRGV